MYYYCFMFIYLTIMSLKLFGGALMCQRNLCESKNELYILITAVDFSVYPLNRLTLVYIWEA